MLYKRGGHCLPTGLHCVFSVLNSSFLSSGHQRCTQSSKRGLTKVLGSLAAVPLSLVSLSPSRPYPQHAGIIPACCYLPSDLQRQCFSHTALSKLVPPWKTTNGRVVVCRPRLTAPFFVCRGELIVCVIAGNKFLFPLFFFLFSSSLVITFLFLV